MKTHYRIHRWLAIPLGIFLFIQAFTGAIYVLPMPRVAAAHAVSPIAWDAVGLSPREVAGDDPATQVLLYSVGDVPVYEVFPVDAAPFCVDARDGSAFQIDETEARRIASGAINTDAPISHVRELDDNEFLYPGGRLPAFHVTFDDGHQVYVEGPSGRVAGRWNVFAKIRDILIRVHDFDLVILLTGSERLTHLLIMGLSGLGGLAILTGYNILWQQRRARLRKEALRDERDGRAPPPAPPPSAS